MGKGIWKLAFAALILLVALLPIGGAVWLIDQAENRQTAYEEQARSNARTFSHLAGPRTEDRCRSLAEPARGNCAIEQARIARSFQRDEFNLEAQRTTAIWTKYMGIAAILGTGFGVVGLALVLATFRQNKRSADAAQDANRPWLELEVLPGDLWIHDDINLELRLRVTNRGNSPATNVGVWSAMPLVCHCDKVDRKQIGPKTLVPLLDEAGRHSRGTTVFPGCDAILEEHGWARPEEVTAALAKDKAPIPYLIAGVAYQHADRTFYTIETFGVVIPEPYNELKTKKGFTAQGFALARHHNSYVV
jgi:hypothetical protein